MIAENDICSMVQAIWETVLDLPACPCPEAALPARCERTVAGCVQITGPWEGTVAIHCGADTARRAAGIMFGLSPEETGLSDVQDAMGELANMVGGNLKGLMPEGCQLSLPTVVEGSDFTLRVPGSRPVTRTAFSCDGRPMLVSLLERLEEPAARN